VATHRQIIYTRVPDGMPDAGCFRLVEAPLPRPAEGQVLARIHFLSIDPYMRRQMGGGHGQYAKPLQPGDVMIGRGAGLVVESCHPDFRSGDRVQGEFGWREHAVLDGRSLRKLPKDLRPLSLSLGIVGQSGATAYVGLVDIADIKAGETVVVSAAAGAVGSAVGQIARINGCRVIGIAGGPAKCQHVVADLRFDDCIDYKAGPIGPALAKAAPQGIDIYFDNVGGDILDAVLPCLNINARVPICGQISQYKTPTSCSINASSSRVFASVAISHGGIRRWTSCWIGTEPAGSNSTRRLLRAWRRRRRRSSTCCRAAISASRWCAWPQPPNELAPTRTC
jgi:NADPH-dependent curcumin reductase